MRVNFKTHQIGGNMEERREQHGVRGIFDDACKITAPFFDKGQSWGGVTMVMSARQTLSDRYPHLSKQDIAILFAAVSSRHKTSQ
jgi:hypothetical protein